MSHKSRVRNEQIIASNEPIVGALAPSLFQAAARLPPRQGNNEKEIAIAYHKSEPGGVESRRCSLSSEAQVSSCRRPKDLAGQITMKYFEHEFDTIDEYLHHRGQYSLVDQILSVDRQQIVTKTTVNSDSFYIQGHFPGAPILPGAMMQELTTQSAGILIAAKYNPMQQYNTEDPFFNEYALGVLVKVNGARYKGFARPGDELHVTVKLTERVGELFDFTGSIQHAGKTIMQNGFRLTNIPSKVLQDVNS